MEQDNSKVSLRERYLYAQGMMGQNVIYNYINTFLNVFYTDILRLAPAAAGLLFLIARVWDAVNDPLMGGIADRTRTRWGKLRPYLMFFSIPIGVVSVLCFMGDGLPEGLRLAYAYVTYILWGMLYTACDIPIWAMCSVISGSEEERTKVLSWIKIGATIGAGVVLVFGIKVVGLFGGSNVASAYLYGALILCGGGAVTMLIAAFSVRERIAPPPEKVPFLQNFMVIFRNPPLLMLLIAMLVSNFAGGVRTAVQLYYVKYVLLDEGLMMLIAAAAVATMLIGMAVTPPLVKRFGNRKLFVASTLLCALFHATAYVMGYDTLALIVANLALAYLFLGINGIAMTALLIDSIEYAKDKLGIRGEGVAFSTQTLMVKLSSALAAAFVLMALDLVGYVSGAMQTAEVMSAIHMLMFLAPAIAYGAAAVPMALLRGRR